MNDNIVCPVCDHEYLDQDAAAHIDYWGSHDEPRHDTCPNCGVTLAITEHVTRRWEIAVISPDDVDGVTLTPDP